MKKNLEPIDLKALSHLEASQLMKRHFDDIASLDHTIITNGPLISYIAQLKSKHAAFDLALVQVRKNDETVQIELLDNQRDKAFSVLKRAVKLASMAETAAEMEAADALQLLVLAYKKIERLNYEAETAAIDNLIRDLESSKYASKVTLLSLKKYVTRLKTSNDAFKALFGDRIQTIASAVTYDAKSLRTDMMATYREFTDYVLAMAQALDTPEFNLVLNLLNTDRKYYADMLSRRISTANSGGNDVAKTS